MKPHTHIQGSLLAALGAVALMGCTGSLEPIGGPGGPISQNATLAQSLFEQRVKGPVEESCDPNGACHSSISPAFVSSDNSYTALMNFKDILFSGFDPATARIVVNGQGGHQGAEFSDNTIALITEWIGEEKKVADSGAGGATAMSIWSGCMNREDWEAENVAALWANKRADDTGVCQTCHRLGEEVAQFTADSNLMFDNYTHYPTFMAGLFTTNALGEVEINVDRHQRVGRGVAPHQEHGSYEVDLEDEEDLAVQALVRFYDLTKLRMIAGDCAPPRFGTGGL